MSATRELLLASASPRRRELLEQIGVDYRIVNHRISESRDAGESPVDFVQRMAREKARDTLTRLPADRHPVVLAADTIVLLGQELLGKPRDRQDGLRMLRLLSGQSHQVYTAVTLCDRQHQESVLSESRVSFRPLREAEIVAYWESGEPCDKAGAYAIQGLAGIFVSRLEGSYSGVVGLPLCETAALLLQFDIPCWRPATLNQEQQQ